MDSNNLVFLLVLGIVSFSFNKFFLFFLKKSNLNRLLDNQYDKPQAFHDSPVAVTGGIGIFFSLLLVLIYSFSFNNVIFFEFLSICTLFFFLGFLDDIKINIRPKARLILMIAFLIFLVSYNNINIDKTGIGFLNELLQSSDIFSLIFVSLCFLFIINGANLIDGYNGLIGILEKPIVADKIIDLIKENDC